MPRGSTRDVVRQLTALCRSGVLGNLDDEQLLERFIELSDESAHEAFAMLLRRHGPMVFGVCLRVLRDAHEAEDAFQATFLVLARKASSVIPREKVANWLYGVAYRTAREARIRAARRRTREQRVATSLRKESPEEVIHIELRAILDDELAYLPARYRGPIVLCELEGLSRQEAAERLGVPEGTLSSRLARGKARLRDRLTRRGLALPAGGISLVAIREASGSVLSDHLIESTTLAAMRVAAGISAAAATSTAVVSLTEGVLKSMLLTKLKGIGLVIGTSLVVVSGAVALGQTAVGGPGGQQADGERMIIMERKLDRIIDALDRMAGAGGGSTSLAAAAPDDAGGKALWRDDVKAEAKTAPSSPYDGAERAKTARVERMIPLADRVESLEQSMRQVQSLLRHLGSRVSELERAGQGGNRSTQPAERAK